MKWSVAIQKVNNESHRIQIGDLVAYKPYENFNTWSEGELASFDFIVMEGTRKQIETLANEIYWDMASIPEELTKAEADLSGLKIGDVIVRDPERLTTKRRFSYSGKLGDVGITDIYDKVKLRTVTLLDELTMYNPETVRYEDLKTAETVK